jgi:hypothetical protein
MDGKKHDVGAIARWNEASALQTLYNKLKEAHERADYIMKTKMTNDRNEGSYRLLKDKITDAMAEIFIISSKIGDR